MNREISFDFLLQKIEDKSTLLVRWAIVVGVILLSALFAMVGTQQKGVMLLALIAAAGGAIILLRWPPLGLVVLTAGSMLVRFAVSTGTQTRLNVAVMLAGVLIGLWLFHLFVYERRFQFVISRPVWPLLAFGVVSVLAFGFGQLNWFIFASKASIVAQAGGLALILLSIGIFLLVGNQVKDMRWIEVLTWLYLLLGGLFVISELVPTFGDVIGRFAPAGVTGSLFWVWLVALALSQALFNQKLNMGWRVALIGLVLAAFAVSFGRNRGWTSGWLPAVISAIVVLWVSGSRWFWLAAIVGAIPVALKVQSSWVGRILLTGDNEYSLMTRLEAWRIMAEIIKVSPILGLGPANYYWYTPLFPILGYTVQFNSHNNYIDIIAQTGLLGLACFLWFAWEIWRLGWGLRMRVPAGFTQAYVFGALGGLAGMLAAGMLGDWVIPFIYNIGFDGFRSSIIAWMFLGGLLVVERLYPSADLQNIAEGQE